MALCRTVELAEFGQHDVVFQEGADPDFFYFVLRGRVEVFAAAELERETSVSLLGR